MWWLNASSVILILGACSACSVSIIYALCVNMRLSRCKTISCCCFNCDRTIETAEEMRMELEADKERMSGEKKPPKPPESVDV